MKHQLIYLLSVFFFAAVTTLFAQEPEPLVIVRVTVGAGYDDTAEGLQELSHTLSQARVRQVSAAKGESPSTVIARNLDFGKSNRPAAYKLVEEAVKNLNQPSFKENAAKGSVLIPDIGPWAWTNYNPKKAANYVPKIAYWRAEQVKIRQEGGAIFSGSPKLIDGGRPASQSIAIEYEVPASTAQMWKSDPGFDGEVLNFPMTVELSSAQDAVGGDDVRLLNSDASQEIGKMLSSPGRSSLLVIADTGWPTPEAYKYSLDNLAAIVSAVRKEYLHLDPIKISSVPFVKSVNGHCRQIERALKEFELLDVPFDRVKAIYVPLTLEQGGGGVIKEFIVTNYLNGIMRSTPHKVKPSDKDEAHARDHADFVLASLIKAWPEGQERVQTDKEVLEAYLHVFNLYSEMKNVDTSFFFNESWTVPHEAFFVAYPSPLRGAVVAATGNHKENVIKGKHDFAQRCVNNRDTIAVMNVGDSGIADDSGRFDEGLIPNAFAVGFDGRLSSDGKEKGTSFSAPRVAWIFAAAEAVRKNRFNMDQWGVDAMGFLAQLRSPEGGFASLRMDPLVFLKRAAQ